MIKPEDKANFETLIKAIENNDVCLIECKDDKTGKYVAVICAVQRHPVVGNAVDLVPLAKLFEGNPYDEVSPPEGIGEIDAVAPEAHPIIGTHRRIAAQVTKKKRKFPPKGV